MAQKPLKRRPSRTFRVAGFDGHFRAKSLLPAYTHHRVMVTCLSLSEAQGVLAKFTSQNPPCGPGAHAYIEEIVTRTGDCYTRESREPGPGGWVDPRENRAKIGA